MRCSAHLKNLVGIIAKGGADVLCCITGCYLNLPDLFNMGVVMVLRTYPPSNFHDAPGFKLSNDCPGGSVSFRRQLLFARLLNMHSR
jgi:hypothetical protein